MQRIAILLISASMWLICCGRNWAITSPGASPAANPQSTSTAQPPSPATPPDAPFPDRGAELRFRSALDAIPDEPEATFKLAKTLEKQGKYAEARVQYKNFLRHSQGGPFEDEARSALKGVEGKAQQHR